jgi:hypothetical protein
MRDTTVALAVVFVLAWSSPLVADDTTCREPAEGLPLEVATVLPPEPILSAAERPAGPWSGQRRLAAFDSILTALLASDTLVPFTIGGQAAVLAPWFEFPGYNACVSSNLKDGHTSTSGPLITGKSLSPPNFLVVSDEFSEVAVVIAMGANVADMWRIDHAVQAMASATYPALPCWIAVANGAGFGCHPEREDSASDATARFGLAYFLAGYNPRFPAADRATFLSRARALAAAHRDLEYRALAATPTGCWTSPITNRPICYLPAAGANAAGNATPEMYIGYFQDQIRFLLAAYADSGTQSFLTRAQDLIDLFLVASHYEDGKPIGFGCKWFKWERSAGGFVTTTCIEGWDVADAPRSLWMGDVLRAHRLATGGQSSIVVDKLQAWVDALIPHESQSTACSCVIYLYNPLNNTLQLSYCQNGHYTIGLGLGLLTERGWTAVGTKLDRGIDHFLWNADPADGRWDTDYPGCFYVFQGVRMLKALASAIGLDSHVYGVVFGDSFESGDTAAWSAVW